MGLWVVLEESVFFVVLGILQKFSAGLVGFEMALGVPYLLMVCDVIQLVSAGLVDRQVAYGVGA
jgi:hypothetical protein